MTSKSKSDDNKAQPVDADCEQSKKADDTVQRKPYEKPTLEKHSDPNLWAFGSM